MEKKKLIFENKSTKVEQILWDVFITIVTREVATRKATLTQDCRLTLLRILLYM